MKRYDLYGGSRNCFQFGAKQFWVVRLTSKIDAWVSYNTVVAIVDNSNHEVISGFAARGYSRTTSKKFNQACYEFARGYDIVAYDSYRYHEFNREHSCCMIDMWERNWDDPNKAVASTYYLASVL